MLEAAASADGLWLALVLGNLLLLVLLLFVVQVLMLMLTPVPKQAQMNEKQEMKAA